MLNILNILKRRQADKHRIIQKGKAFYVATSTGNVVPMSALDRYEIRKSRSKQLKIEDKWYEQNGLKAYPYSRETLLMLYESNVIFSRAVNQIATDVAGIGWKLNLREGAKENAKERERIEQILHHPNDEGDSLRNICEACIIDWGVFGYYAIEVVRSADDMVAEIYHARADNLYVHKSKKKYAQKSDSKLKWFVRYNLRDSDDGRVILDPDSGEEKDLPLEVRANELIYYKTHSPLNDYYGMPLIVPAIGEVFSLMGIRDYNLSFFTNYGVPAYVITLDGDWDDDTESIIRNFLETEAKGTENQHRSLVLRIPAEEDADGKIIKGSVTFEPVSVDIKEGSFRMYRMELRTDVLAAYSMPEYRVGINTVGKLGGTNIREATEIYKQGVVEPRQEDVENIINYLILEQGLDCHSYEVKFNDMDTRDMDSEAERADKYFKMAAITPNWIRTHILDLEPYPGGDSFYVPATMIEVGEDVEKRDMSEMEEFDE